MTISRRRFLTICAAACAIPIPAKASRYQWRGSALGAPASITLSGGGASAMATLAQTVEAEILRLERIFSLFLPDSALVRLNRAGHLPAPPPEMLALFSLADVVHRQTDGAFDPTVQSLWRLYATAGAEGRSPSPQELTTARQQTGWRHVRFSMAEVSMRRPGVELTLNGIAQGYIADRIADLLRAAGYRDVLIDMGEINALGQKPDGTPWRAGIATPAGEIIAEASL